MNICLFFEGTGQGATGTRRGNIPRAEGNPDSRVYAYEVVVVGDKGTPKLYKAVYAAGGAAVQRVFLGMDQTIIVKSP